MALIMRRALLLASGGLDSSVAAWMLPDGVRCALALTIDYGQRAARRELAAGYRIARALEVEHRTLFLPLWREARAGALVERGTPLPEPDESDLDASEGAGRASADSVWVPNRNAVLIAVAAAWAEARGHEHVVCGFNREEARTFPDNGPDFLEATNAALALSTRGRVSVLAPTIDLDKAQIVREGRARGVPLEACWSCYAGGDEPCLRCESCRRWQRAFREAGVPLPTPTGDGPPEAPESD